MTRLLLAAFLLVGAGCGPKEECDSPGAWCEGPNAVHCHNGKPHAWMQCDLGVPGSVCTPFVDQSDGVTKCCACTTP